MYVVVSAIIARSNIDAHFSRVVFVGSSEEKAFLRFVESYRNQYYIPKVTSQG